jgi:hypothetical protein
MSRRTLTNEAAGAAAAAENENGRNSRSTRTSATTTGPSISAAAADDNDTISVSPRSPTTATTTSTATVTTSTATSSTGGNAAAATMTAISNAKAEPPLLYKHVLAKNWTQVLTRIAEAPQEAHFLDDFGLSPLHRACYRDAPMGVVQALIEASSSTLLATQDKCDFSGLTPLHAACHYCSPEVVKVLLKANPEALDRRNTKHQTPLECACQVYNNRIRHTLDRTTKEMVAHDDFLMANANRRNANHQSSTLAARRPEYADLLTEDATLRRFFKVACLLLQAQVGTPLTCTLAGDDDEAAGEGSNSHCTNTNMVHACAMAATTVPHILLELCLKIYPEQVQAVTCTCDCLQNNTSNGHRVSSCCCNGKGKLALHEALECGGRDLMLKSHSDNTLTTMRLQQNHFLQNFQMILEAHPDATSVRNVAGELPFVVARRCGLAWSLGMQTLLEHHPQALYSVPQLELSDKTVCHVLAKAGRIVAMKNRKKVAQEDATNTKDDETADTSLLFGLLQCHPSVMQHASTSEVVVAASTTQTQPLREVSHVVPLRRGHLMSSPIRSSNKLLDAGFAQQQNEFKEIMLDMKHLDKHQQPTASRSNSSPRFSLTLWKPSSSSRPKKSNIMRRCQSENGIDDNEPTASTRTQTQHFAKSGSSRVHNHNKRDVNVSPLSIPWLVQKLIGGVGNGKRPANNNCAKHSSACGCAAEPESTK